MGRKSFLDIATSNSHPRGSLSTMPNGVNTRNVPNAFEVQGHQITPYTTSTLDPLKIKHVFLLLNLILVVATEKAADTKEDGCYDTASIVKNQRKPVVPRKASIERCSNKCDRPHDQRYEETPKTRCLCDNCETKKKAPKSCNGEDNSADNLKHFAECCHINLLFVIYLLHNGPVSRRVFCGRLKWRG